MFLQKIIGEKVDLCVPSEENCMDWMWDNYPEVYKYLPEPHILQTIESQKDFLEEIRNEVDGWYWSIEHKITGECVGIVSITQINEYHGIGELGIVIGKPEYFGKGYATEVIKMVIGFLQNTKKLRRITAECEADNKPMIKVLEKCGFTLETVCKESRIKNNHPIDTFRYFILI